MTLRALKLEEFGAGPAGMPGAPPGVDTEEIRLTAYETGYKSGWDDAIAEREKSDHLIAADLERNLQDISYTYAEARAEILGGLNGLFASIVSGFLPAIAAEAIGPLVTRELEDLVAQLGEGRCDLLASPRTAEQLRWLVDQQLEADLHITEEPAFADGRVSIRFANEEREIDLSQMVEKMTTAIREFNALTPQLEERQNA